MFEHSLFTVRHKSVVILKSIEIFFYIKKELSLLEIMDVEPLYKTSFKKKCQNKYLYSWIVY